MAPVTRSASIRLACIGECMIELSERADGSFSRAFGGDTLNTAVYAARLGAPRGVEVDYITALGDDPYSEAMLDFWRAEGVGTGLVQRRAGELPGLYVIRTTDAGERSFFYWRSAAAARGMLQGEGGEAILAALPGYDLIYLSGITLSILATDDRDRLLTGIDAARAKGARVAFDSNYRPRGWPDVATARAAMDEAFARCDIALPSADDERVLNGADGLEDIARRIAGLGVAEICVSDGEQPCGLWHDGAFSTVAGAGPVKAVDTTAAGDSFNAAYLTARLLGRAPEAAARAGHRLAAEVVRHRGAVIPAEAMPRSIEEQQE